MSVVAARYARALADAVFDDKLDPARVQEQLEDFAGILDGSKDLREALLNPSLSSRKRVAVLDAIVQRTGSEPKVRNFLAVLIAHERLNVLDEIREEFRLEMNRRLSIADAEVISARKLAQEERAELEKHAAALAGTAVHATFREDASLIGGAIVRIGSTVYDGSVRGRLERLKEELAAN